MSKTVKILIFGALVVGSGLAFYFFVIKKKKAVNPTEAETIDKTNQKLSGSKPSAKTTVPVSGRTTIEQNKNLRSGATGASLN